MRIATPCSACGHPGTGERHCSDGPACPWWVCDACRAINDNKGHHNCGPRPQACRCQRGDA